MYQVLCTKEKHRSWMHLRHVLSVHQIFRWASTGLQSVSMSRVFDFLLCIIIESIAADFYKDSCCVSLHNWGLLITCDFAFSIVLLPWRTLVLMEKEWKALFSPPDIFIFLLYILVVYYVLPTFFSLLWTQFGNF